METIFKCGCGIDRFIRVQRFHIDGPLVRENWDGQAESETDSLPRICCMGCSREYDLYKGQWVLVDKVDV